MKLALVALTSLAIFLTGCNSSENETWYGTGHVVGKVLHNDCYFLTIEDDQGIRHERCVSERVWNDAMPDHQITITKEYH